MSGRAASIVPVWIEPWQIECCRPELMIGDAFRAPLVSWNPRWQPTAFAEPLLEVVGLGSWRFQGQVEQQAEVEDATLLRVGSVTIATTGVPTIGLVEGVLEAFADWHTSPFPDVCVTGRVVAVFDVPTVRRLVQVGEHEIVAEQLPQPIRGTRDCSKDSTLLLRVDLTRPGRPRGRLRRDQDGRRGARRQPASRRLRRLARR